jgi:hypothetical protein
VTDPLDPIESTITHFSQMYLNGIPHLIRDETAILSFVVTLCATEALAGYRYANTLGKNSGARFNAFVSAYFPPEYAPFASGRLWRFRCRLVHGFSPAGFALVHYHREVHLTTERRTNNPFLNAEDFYDALRSASHKFFAEVRADASLRQLFNARLNDPKHGGHIGVNRGLTTRL